MPVHLEVGGAGRADLSSVRLLGHGRCPIGAVRTLAPYLNTGPTTWECTGVMPTPATSGRSDRARNRAGNLDKRAGWCHFRRVSQSKLDQLQALLRSYGSCLVAYSGGVDSVFLARVARDVLGDKALAVIADSPSLPRRELTEALEIAKRFGIPVRVVRPKEFENPDYLANPLNRCYYCKQELFAELTPIARAGGFAVIAYGENASDTGDFRPGAEAAREMGARAPLKEAGLTKAEIRGLSAQLGLPTADKPQMACLSSRLPYGEAVTPEKLRMIEQAEALLRDLGFYDVRVRHHELRGVESGARSDGVTEDSARASRLAFPGVSLPTVQHLARIEVAPAEMPRLIGNGTASRVGEALRKIGYAHVTVDLAGYRRGSANEGLARPAESTGSAASE